MKEQTPLMKQYWELKNQHTDKILFFRMGDFFELFYDDAVTVAPLLGLTLTQRNKKANDDTPMCGVPYHSIAAPINKLLSYGYKVAICDQLEDPKLAKGIVKRGVTRILTPGMVFDPDSLDASSPNYIACFTHGELALADSSTGEAFYFDHLSSDQLIQIKVLYPIVEWVFRSINEANQLDISQYTLFKGDLSLSARELLRSYLVSLVQDEKEILVKHFEKRSFQVRMKMNPQCIRHLEIFETYKGDKKGSLYWAINKTQSSLGARLLRDWLTSPLTDLHEIKKRQNQIQFWLQNLDKRDRAVTLLKQMGDIERKLSRVIQGHSNARDLKQLIDSIQIGLQVVQLTNDAAVNEYAELMVTCQKAESTLVDDLPLSVRQGYLIKKGVDQQLDEYIELSTNSHSLLLEMEAREKVATQIPSLKIRYNNVFGYYIEITNTHRDKVPAHYIRKQTLANAERYYTDELLELEKKILSAESKRFELEYQIFENLRLQVSQQTLLIRKLASNVAQIDVTCAAAQLILERNYNLPNFHTLTHLRLESCRHPVVELSVSQFTPNTITMNQGQVILITGPNMAGKSTLMRQVALNILLAQIGFPVASSRADVPIFDGIFTRIGASDHLSEGLSTFMVEMQESGYILKNYQERSLIILDEIGRGTSTYDGLSLAQAILESILQKKMGYTFFATHYHELTGLEIKYPSLLENTHMSIQESRSKIEFLHTLKKGPAQKSYGIYVAQLAGLPESVIKDAKKNLRQLELSHQPNAQLNLFQSFLNEEATDNSIIPDWVSDLRAIDINQMTPLSALQYLQSLKEKASGHHT
jgi:DNA mismatch repair protein MutS